MYSKGCLRIEIKDTVTKFTKLEAPSRTVVLSLEEQSCSTEETAVVT